MPLTLNSCYLVTIPIKATGEIVEKTAYATRDIGSRGIQKLREPAEPSPEGYQDNLPYGDPAYDTGPDYGSDDYYKSIR
jgi:hypothetical protein